ncbi:MAG: Alcohol dehydrogenase zinc-binding domain protein [Actinomycetia bacterium]|nr:Alcohol dehydrogenase zinc-binding domain protein [Actinomycetes bacterium]
MKAIRQFEFGGPEVLRWADVPDPVAGDGQVVIDVEAAGVHLVDATIRRGEPFGPMGVATLPMTPGREVAGRVDGRPVVAHLGFANGGYAERAVAPVASLHELPEGIDPAEAVAMIGTGRTAVLLLDQAALRADDVVLVPAAAGGLGALFLQAARNAGALAYGLASPAKLGVVAELGGVPVDYTQPAWPEAIAHRPTVLLDGVGGAAGRAAAELLGPGGRAVVFGWSAGEPTSYDGLDVAVTRMERPADLRPLEVRALAALAGGSLRPLVTRFALADAAAAHAALEGRATTGKVVLVP